jgi:hypothetical protein
VSGGGRCRVGHGHRGSVGEDPFAVVYDAETDDIPYEIDEDGSLAQIGLTFDSPTLRSRIGVILVVRTIGSGPESRRSSVGQLFQFNLDAVELLGSSQVLQVHLSWLGQDGSV